MFDILYSCYAIDKLLNDKFDGVVFLPYILLPPLLITYLRCGGARFS